MRAVLRRPDFRLLFSGVVSTMIGESALLLVLAIWVKDLTGSSRSRWAHGLCCLRTHLDRSAARLGRRSVPP